MKKHTVSDIAKIAKTSPASVSRVINDLPGVNPVTRDRIKKVLNDVNYSFTPKTFRMLSMGNSIKQYSRIIALIVGDIRNPFYADLTYYIQNLLIKSNYYVMLFNSEYNEKKELEFLGLADTIGFAGVITVTAMESRDFLKVINSLSCPLVLVNRTIESYTGPTVLLDNFQAGYTATKHLIELGHSRISFLTGPESSSSSKQRVLGYIQALENYSIHFKSSDIFQGDLTMESGYVCGRKISEKIDSSATAIVCGNDLMAIGLMQACEENKISIPKDLSIVGFDDISISRLSKINLTTMRQPTSIMANRTVELLLEIVMDKSVNKRVILESELIVRNTTSRPRYDL